MILLILGPTLSEAKTALSRSVRIFYIHVHVHMRHKLRTWANVYIQKQNPARTLRTTPIRSVFPPTSRMFPVEFVQPV